METLFFLSIPGLVLLITILGAYKLVRSKITGEKRPTAGEHGFEIMDQVFRPGSEHRVIEKRKLPLKIKKTGNQSK